MCEDKCQPYFCEKLGQIQVPKPRHIDVYYITPYEGDQAGSVLLSAYQNLGFTFP
jgi:hypothetical protein